MPMFYGQVMNQNYLKGPSVIFWAVGDYTSKEAPLLVTDLVNQPSQIDDLLLKCSLKA